jgi:hypothetical protein
MSALFPLGQIVATPGALAALERAKQPPTCFLARHAIGDWGELEPADVGENKYSLIHGPVCVIRITGRASQPSSRMPIAAKGKDRYRSYSL